MRQQFRLVWAAVFAKHFSLRNPPKHVLKPGQEEQWKEWEQGKTIEAIEMAGHAIEHLLEARPRVLEGWSEDSIVARAFCDMMDIR